MSAVVDMKIWKGVQSCGSSVPDVGSHQPVSECITGATECARTKQEKPSGVRNVRPFIDYFGLAFRT